MIREGRGVGAGGCWRVSAGVGGWCVLAWSAGGRPAGAWRAGRRHSTTRCTCTVAYGALTAASRSVRAGSQGYVVACVAGRCSGDLLRHVCAARRTGAVPRRPPDRTRRHAPLARACGCPCCRCSCCRSCSRARQQVSYTLYILTNTPHTTSEVYPSFSRDFAIRELYNL